MNTYLQKIHDAITEAIQGLNDEQMRRHPEGKWCTAEILEHLALTYGTTERVLRKCLDAGKPLARKPSWRDRFITVLVTKLGYIPFGRKSPSHALPSGMGPSDARSLCFTNLSKLDETMQSCEQRYGRINRITDHPVLGPLTLDEWRKFHLLHALHHMKQIEKLRP